MGLPNATVPCDIEVTGAGVMDHHCSFEYDGTELVTLFVQQGAVVVNGQLVVESVEVVQGQLVQIGADNIFRFNNPVQVSLIPPKKNAHGGTQNSVTQVLKTAFMEVLNPSYAGNPTPLTQVL